MLSSTASGEWQMLLPGVLPWGHVPVEAFRSQHLNTRRVAKDAEALAIQLCTLPAPSVVTQKGVNQWQGGDGVQTLLLRGRYCTIESTCREHIL